jgi:hypothetical protein
LRGKEEKGYKSTMRGHSLIMLMIISNLIWRALGAFGVWSEPWFGLVSVVKDSTLAIRRGDHSDLPLAFIFEEVDPSFAAIRGLEKTFFFLCRLSYTSGGRFVE